MTTTAELVAEHDAIARWQKGEAARSRYVPHEPHPKQREFLALVCKEALYGGAAGGGKSDALLMAALQYVHVPGYAALLLRRTYADLALPEAIMDRASDWLSPTDARWNGQDKRWTFPSGASLTFGYLDTDKDRYRYSSAAFQFIGFDELTQFPEPWYRFLFSRLRRSKASDVPLRVRGATNPGNIGHEWVRRRFLTNPGSPPFIAAKIFDNPSLDAASYLESLSELDPVTLQQLRDGIWVRDSGGLVYMFDEGRNLIAELPAGEWSYLLSLDFGFTDATAFAILGWLPNSPFVYVVESFKEEKLTPSQVGEKCVELEQKYKFTRIIGDIGGLGKGYAEEMRRRFRLPVEPADKHNKRGYIDLLNGDLTHGNLKVYGPSNAGLIKEWLELPWNADRSKASEGCADHLCDAVTYGWRATTAYLTRPIEPVAETADEIIRSQTREYWERAEQAQVQAANSAVYGFDDNDGGTFYDET